MIEKHFVKIYGARRTGTNFIHTLIKQNCTDTRCFDNQFGPKHGVPVREASGFFKKIEERFPDRVDYFQEINNYLKKNTTLHSIVIIKNPYSWYYSIKRYTIKGDKGPFRFEYLYNQYDSLYRAYRDFYYNQSSYGEQFGKVKILKYEDLLKDPEKIVRPICKSFGNIPMKDKFIIPNRVDMSKPFDVKRKDFYLRADTFDLPPNVVRDINNIIDWDLMSFYGYKRIDV